MTTTESCLPLSMFLPGNLPPEDEMQRELEAHTEYVFSVQEPLRTVSALALYGHGRMPIYDKDFLPFEDALENHTGNCLTVAALTAVAGKLVQGIVTVPTIETYRAAGDEETNKSLHAFNTVRAASGQTLRCENLSGASLFASYSALHPSTRLERFVADHPELLGSDGIVQIRQDTEGHITVLEGRDSRTPHTASTLAAFTLFTGDEGLKSYLTTIEKLSARRQGRSANTWPDQLIPRL